MTIDTSSNPTAGPVELRDQWLGRLVSLMEQIEHWGRELDWVARRLDKQMTDSEIGTYQAPAVLLQKDTTRLLVEPVARAAPGADGVVDLYLMPGLDDVASLYFYDGNWHLHYSPPPSRAVAGVRSGEAAPLSKDTFRQVVEGMVGNGR